MSLRGASLNELLLERLSSHMSGGRSSNHVASWQSVAESLQRAADFYHMNNRGYSAATVCYHYYAAMYRFQEASAAMTNLSRWLLTLPLRKCKVEDAQDGISGF